MKNLIIPLIVLLCSTLTQGQNECENKPIPSDGYELTGLKRLNQQVGCIVYWLEYSISLTKFCIINHTDRTIHVTKAEIHSRKSIPTWDDIY